MIIPKKTFLKSIIFLVVGIVFCNFNMVNAAGSAYFSFSPSSKEINVNSSFNVDVVILPNGEAINTARAMIKYPSDLLDAEFFNLGATLPYVSPGNYIDNEKGIISYGGFSDINANADFVFGTILFKAKKEGVGEVVFLDTSRIISAGLEKSDSAKSGKLLIKIKPEVLEERAPEIISKQETQPVNNFPESTAVEEKKVSVLQIKSDNFPDSEKWYNENSSTFSWMPLPGVLVDKYYYDFNDKPEFDPQNQIDGNVLKLTFSNIEDGIWFFHLKAKLSDGSFTKTESYKIKADNSPPENFEPFLEDSEILSNEQTNLLFSTTDKTSGIAYYEVSDDSKNWSKIESPFGVEKLFGGDYLFYLRAVDNAGNITYAKTPAILNVSGPAKVFSQKHCTFIFLGIDFSVICAHPLILLITVILILLIVLLLYYLKRYMFSTRKKKVSKKDSAKSKKKKSKKLMFMIFTALLIFGIAGFCDFKKASAAIPSYLGYQGRLKDSSNNPQNGTLSFIFRIYDAETAGSLLWSETQNVTVTDGYFAVSLGTISALNLAFDKPYWFTVEVGGDGEMAPRVRINSVGYTYTSDKAYSAENLAAAPVGTLGRIYYDTLANKMYYYNGAWVDFGAWSKTGTNLSPLTSGDDILLHNTENLTMQSMTPGSMLFSGTGGLVSQDNSNLFWDDTNNYLGIGSNIPTEKLYVNGNGIIKNHVSIGNDSTIDKDYPLGGSMSSLIDGREAVTDLSTKTMVNGNYYALTLNPAAPVTSAVYGSNFEIYTDSANTEDYGTLEAAWNYVGHQGSGTVGSAYGTENHLDNTQGTIDTAIPTYNVLVNRSGATVGDFYGNYIGYSNVVGGTINNAYLLYISQGLNTGTVTNNYGIYLEDQTVGANSYAIYSAGGKSYHAGNLGLGVVIPTQKLDVDGNIRLAKQGDLMFADADSSNYVSFQAPAVLGGNMAWTLPLADGAAGTFLTTNGAGVLSFAAITVPADSLNYTEFNDSMTLDATTTTALSTFNNVFNLNSTGDLVLQDNGTPFLTANDDKSIDYTTDQTTTNGIDIVANSLTTADAINAALNGLTTGRGLSISTSSGSFSNTTTGLVSFQATGAGTGNLLYLENAGNSNAVVINESKATANTTKAGAGLRINVSQDARNGYALYLDDEESGGTNKIFGIETDDITGGQTADTEHFYVRADGVTKVYSSAATAPTRSVDGEFGFFDAGVADANKRLYFRVNGVDRYINSDGAGDYSEYFKVVDRTLKPGEIVSINKSLANGVKKTNKIKDADILGVVSAQGTRNNDDPENGMRHKDPNYANIGLLGQLPVLVNNENGEIGIGDYITSSSTPGVGMKADLGDPTLGIALESFDGASGKIQILLSRNNGSMVQSAASSNSTVEPEPLASAESANIKAGKIAVLTGATLTKVVFTDNLNCEPVVTVTPRGNFAVRYWVSDETKEGFIVNISEQADQDLSFSWLATCENGNVINTSLPVDIDNNIPSNTDLNVPNTSTDTNNLSDAPVLGLSIGGLIALSAFGASQILLGVFLLLTYKKKK